MVFGSSSSFLLLSPSSSTAASLEEEDTEEFGDSGPFSLAVAAGSVIEHFFEEPPSSRFGVITSDDEQDRSKALDKVL